MERIGSILDAGYLAGIRRQMEAHQRAGTTATDRALDDVANAMEADRRLQSEIADVADQAVSGKTRGERVQEAVERINPQNKAASE